MKIMFPNPTDELVIKISDYQLYKSVKIIDSMLNNTEKLENFSSPLSTFFKVNNDDSVKCRTNYVRMNLNGADITGLAYLVTQSFNKSFMNKMVYEKGIDFSVNISVVSRLAEGYPPCWSTVDHESFETLEDALGFLEKLRSEGLYLE